MRGPAAHVAHRRRKQPIGTQQLGLDVLFLQFAKKLVCAEHEIAPQIGLEIAQATRETPELCAQQILNLAHWALAPAGDAPDASIPIAARNKPVDVLVLDEVGYAMHRGYVTRADIEKLIASKPATTELVLTGRGLLDLADRADLVTEMVPIKHYFDEGLLARRGIEY